MKKIRLHIPSQIRGKSMTSKLKPGEMRAFFENDKGILIFRAQDYSATKSDFIIISTLHTNKRVPMLDKQGKQKIYVAKDKRKKEPETRTPMTEPVARKDYNVQKDPVDTSDSKTASSSPHIKHLKWYQRTFDELAFNTCVVNAYEILRWVKGDAFNPKRSTVPEERKVLYLYLLNSGLEECKLYFCFEDYNILFYFSEK